MKSWSSRSKPGARIASFDIYGNRSYRWKRAGMRLTASDCPGRSTYNSTLCLRARSSTATRNLLAFGNPGSGKTHLLCAIGQELVHRGHRVLFTTCSLLVQELLLAKRELRLARLLKRFAKFRPLIIDDIGYVQQDREEMEVLFTLLAERYERGSIILTSNLPFSKWEKIFKDPMTTAAAIDRLVHHSIILELNVASYRLEQSKKNKARVAKTAQNRERA